MLSAYLDFPSPSPPQSSPHFRIPSFLSFRSRSQDQGRSEGQDGGENSFAFRFCSFCGVFLRCPSSCVILRVGNREKVEKADEAKKKEERTHLSGHAETTPFPFPILREKEGGRKGNFSAHARVRNRPKPGKKIPLTTRFLPFRSGYAFGFGQMYPHLPDGKRGKKPILPQVTCLE